MTHIATPEVADRIQQAVDDLDATIREIRGVIFAFQAHERGEQSLRAEVLGLTAEMAATLGFAPRVHFDGPVDVVVNGSLATDLLAVLRELLSNVARHAGATSVDVDVVTVPPTLPTDSRRRDTRRRQPEAEEHLGDEDSVELGVDQAR